MSNEKYKIGDTIKGEIKGIAEFGAFIKFPVNKKGSETKEQDSSRIEGLIHISELDWQLIEDHSEVVKIGEIVQAKIIEINNNQVFLSLKSLKKDPWKEVEKKYKKGDIVKGKVIKFSPFGALCKLHLRSEVCAIFLNLEQKLKWRNL